MKSFVLVAFAAVTLMGCTVTTTGPDDDDGSSGNGGTVAEPDYTTLFGTSKSSSADATKLDGLWGAEVGGSSDAVKNVKAEYRFQFRDGRMTIASRCSADDYETIVVGVNTPATWADGTLTVKGEAINHDKVVPGPAGKPTITCKASVTGAGTTKYSLASGKLTAFGLTLEKYAD